MNLLDRLKNIALLFTISCITACGQPGANGTEDPADYASVIHIVEEAGTGKAASHFPHAIPSSATEVQFLFSPISHGYW